ncbi:gastrula zinc finger protein XlCGF48.2-like isoform X2 [Hyperolius riggenbachi]|uniref:gastrula zinc finger protein XlCGF48.2-like isoform X2 n=1 Tax=Hyperolius riggenbachi TaxID=752182 RepID=UPI0035A29416
MAKDGNHMTERILNLTLEIVYLLTGENYVAFKLSDGLVASNIKKTTKAILESSSHSSKKKMQEVTTEMIELLTGEDVTDYFSVEEEEYLEDQTDLLMENEQLLTSQDGSRNTNPPKRLAGPPYVSNLTHKDDNRAQDYQAENIFKVQVELTENGEEPYAGGDVQSEEVEMDPQISTDPRDTKGTQTSIKVEQDIIAVKIKEEDIHSEIGTDGHYYRSNILSPDGDGEDDITSDSPRENPINSNLYGKKLPFSFSKEMLSCC